MVNYHLLMEYAPCGDLFGQIYKAREKRNNNIREKIAIVFYEQESRHICKQLLSGLGYLHGRKITHRDLKPENVLVTQWSTIDGKTSYGEPQYETCKGVFHTVKIADFGSSKFGTLITREGTPLYRAPEISGTANYTEKVDCWSLGAVLFIMQAGKLPFTPQSYPEIATNRTEAWYQTANSGKAIVQGLLRKNPAVRFGLTRCNDHPWIQNAHEHENELDLNQEEMRGIFEKAIKDCGKPMVKTQADLVRREFDNTWTVKATSRRLSEDEFLKQYQYKNENDLETAEGTDHEEGFKLAFPKMLNLWAKETTAEDMNHVCGGKYETSFGTRQRLQVGDFMFAQQPLDADAPTEIFSMTAAEKESLYADKEKDRSQDEMLKHYRDYIKEKGQRMYKTQPSVIRRGKKI